MKPRMPLSSLLHSKGNLPASLSRSWGIALTRPGGILQNRSMGSELPLLTDKRQVPLTPLPFIAPPLNPPEANPLLSAALASIASEPGPPPTIYSLPPRHYASTSTRRPETQILSSEDYVTRQRNDPSTIYNLSPTTWHNLLLTLEQGSPPSIFEVKEQIVEDFIFSALRRPEDFFPLILSLLHSPLRTGLSSSQVLELFHAFPAEVDISKRLSRDALAIVHEAIASETHFDIYIPFIRTTFQQLILPTQPPHVNCPPNEANKRIVWILFRIINRLLQLHNPQERLAVDILAALVEAGHIPSVVLHWTEQTMTGQSENTEKALGLLLLETCVLTCFIWGWHKQALGLLSLHNHEFTLEEGVDRNHWWAHQGSPPNSHPGKSRIQEGFQNQSLSTEVLRESIPVILRTLLQLPSTDDLQAATTLLLAYEEHSTLGGRAIPAEILELYFQSAKDTLPALTIAQVYQKYRSSAKIAPMTTAYLAGCGEIPAEMQEQLLTDLLVSDEVDPRASNRRATLDVPVSVAIHAVQQGLLEPAIEIWSRARNRREGYSYTAICGDQNLVKDLVECCLRRHEDQVFRYSPAFSHSQGTPKPLHLAGEVLAEFSKIRLKFPEQTQISGDSSCIKVHATYVKKLEEATGSIAGHHH